jgi:hypothetical protein
VHQVVSKDVLIVGRLDVDGQSFALGLHKTDVASLIVAHKLALHLYERLVWSPVTKLIR